MHRLSDITGESYLEDHVVALVEDESLTWAQMKRDVAATMALLSASEDSQWALFEADSYRFAVGLLALLACGKTVYLPAENHAAMVAALVQKDAQFLGQFPHPKVQNVLTEQMSERPVELKLSGTVVVFTSGSTGEPKGITKTLAQLDEEIAALELFWGEQLKDSVIVGAVSHQHLYGLLFLVLWPLAAGRPFWRKPFVDPVILAGTMAAYKAAAWILSPAHLHRLSETMPWDEVRGTTTAVFSSGGPLAHSGAQALWEGLGQYPCEVLGSSETGGIAWRQQRDSSASWLPLPGVQIQLDAQGALTVKSAWLPDDSWYVTADLATLDGEGGFSLGPRLDRIVKVEGKRVSLPETEARLESHPWIEECRVILMQRRRQTVGAALVLSPEGAKQYTQMGRNLFSRKLRHYLRDQLAAAAIPRIWRVTPEMPRNVQGKILQKHVQALFETDHLPVVVVRNESDNACSLSLIVSPDSVYFAGHFSQASVLPGVVQVLWAQQFAAKYLGLKGQFVGMQKIKFKDLVFPQQELTLTLKYSPNNGQLRFLYESAQSAHSQGILLYEAVPLEQRIG